MAQWLEHADLEEATCLFLQRFYWGVGRPSYNGRHGSKPRPAQTLCWGHWGPRYLMPV